MPIMGNTVIMVQHFPATDDYIVHMEGDKVDVYHGMSSIQDSKVNQFVRECLENKLYHEGTVHLATGKVAGAKTLPVKQVIYCKSFDATRNIKSASSASHINWVLWSPSNYELTVNRGLLGMSKAVRIRELSDAPAEIREFMTGCTDGQHVALCHHFSDHDRSGGTGKMLTVSEYFFSMGKIIYGFQHEHVYPITYAELVGLGLVEEP